MERDPLSRLEEPASVLAAEEPGAVPRSERLVSLDAFRGLTMMLMVLVNNAGSDAMYAELQHSPWNGWTIADTIFPAFLWIAGVAVTLSLGKRLTAGARRSHLLAGVARRAAILYVLGLIVYAAPAFDLSTQRLLGVLQRIAICYLIGAAIYLWTGVRGQILCTAALLALYWLLMTFVPVPGHGAGDLTVAGNFSHYIDSLVLGRHNYASTKTWDPEGIVSTIPSVATILLGILAGQILRLKRSLAERTVWLFLCGTALLLLGLVWNVSLPINKKLWTSSFTLFMAGLDFICFAVFLWLVDGCGWKRMVKPFVIMGMNAIAIYMASELFDELISGIVLSNGHSVRSWIFHTVFSPIPPPAFAALLYAAAFTLLMYGLAVVLYRRKIFLRV